METEDNNQDNGIRFENAPAAVDEMIKEVLIQYFPHFVQEEDAGPVIKSLFDLKKRMVGPKLVLGRIMKANDLIRNLTEHLVSLGCDYIMFIDKKAWTLTDVLDKIRLIRHELRHILYNPDSKNCWQVLPHDIEDFAIEVSLNKDEPGWANRVAEIVKLAYEQEAEAKKEAPVVPSRPRIQRGAVEFQK
jgi:hypothetical protein